MDKYKVVSKQSASLGIKESIHRNTQLFIPNPNSEDKMQE